MSPLLLLSSFIYFDLVFFFLFLFLVPSMVLFFFFFFSSRRRHTRWTGDWSSDVCSSDLPGHAGADHQPGFRGPGAAGQGAARAGPRHLGVARHVSAGARLLSTTGTTVKAQARSAGGRPADLSALL